MIPEPDDLLYHYTSANGLLGIFKEKAIWATAAAHLNDSQEVWHAIKMVKELLPEFESEHPAVPVARALFETHLERHIPKLFIAAWTEKGDQLSQWRGYGGGARHTASASVGKRYRRRRRPRYGGWSAACTTKTSRGRSFASRSAT